MKLYTDIVTLDSLIDLITLAKEEHFIAMLSAGVCVWAILSWTRGPLAERAVRQVR